MLMSDNYHIWRLLSSCRPEDANISRLLQIVDEWRDSGYLWLRALVTPMPPVNPPLRCQRHDTSCPSTSLY